MRRPKLTRPTVELFPEALDVNQLNRSGAFAQPMHYPLRRMKTFPDRIEISFRKTNYWQRPPAIILIERAALFPGSLNSRPWFICSHCSCRCGKLYTSSIDVRCRKCADLQWQCQRQFWTTRLRARADKIRNRLWVEGEKIIRPRLMRQRTFQKHLNKLRMIEHALSMRSPIHWIRSRDHLRPRDSDGRYCD